MTTRSLLLREVFVEEKERKKGLSLEKIPEWPGSSFYPGPLYHAGCRNGIPSQPTEVQQPTDLDQAVIFHNPDLYRA